MRVPWAGYFSIISSNIDNNTIIDVPTILINYYASIIEKEAQESNAFARSAENIFLRSHMGLEMSRSKSARPGPDAL